MIDTRRGFLADLLGFVGAGAAAAIVVPKVKIVEAKPEEIKRLPTHGMVLPIGRMTYSQSSIRYHGKFMEVFSIAKMRFGPEDVVAAENVVRYMMAKTEMCKDEYEWSHAVRES